MVDLKNFAQKLGLDWDVALEEDKSPVMNVDDGEQLSCSYKDVELAVGDAGSSAGPGCVFVTTRRLVWVPGSNCEPGSISIACSYKQISMHAIARDTEVYPKPCIYLQLDEGSVGFGVAGEEEEEEEEDDEEDTAELRLVPNQESEVDALFQALCDASALNPDSDMEEEAGAQLFFDEAEVLAGLSDEQRAALLAAQAEGAMALDEVDQLMAQDPERFEDEDEYEDDGEEEEGGGETRLAAGAQQHSTAPQHQANGHAS